MATTTTPMGRLRATLVGVGLAVASSWSSPAVAVELSLEEKAGSAALSPEANSRGVGGETSPPDHIVPPAVEAEVAATYPDDARAEGVAGDVILEVELDARGQLARLVVVQTPDRRLSWAAMGALSRFQFRPAGARHDDGTVEAVPIRFHYTMSFTIEPPAAPATATVRGTVHVENDESDIAGAHVHVHGNDDGSGVDVDLGEVVTDGLGQFELKDMPAGGITLVVDATGFIGVRVPVQTVAGATHDLLVHLEPVPVRTTTQETVVSGRAGRERVARTLTQAVAVVDQRAIARVRGRSLADTISEVPGVTMVQAGPAQQKPVVRGAFGRRLVLLTDGVRHEGQDWGIDHAPELDVTGAGQITIVKGAAGVRYGADAIGGVILVEAPSLRLDPGLSGEVFSHAVDNGLRGGLGGRVDIVLPQQKDLTLRLEGNTSRSAAVSTPDYVLGNTGSAIDNVAATLEWRALLFEKAVTTRLSYRHHEAVLGTCFCLEVATPADLTARLQAPVPAGADAWTTTYDIDRPRQQVRHDTAIAKVQADLGVAQLTATYAFQRDDRDEFDQVRRAVEGPQYSFLLHTHAVDVSVQHARFRWGRWSAVGQTGLRGDVQEHSYEGLQLIPNYRRFTGGVFALERLILDDAFGLGDLELIAGARGDGLTQTSFLTERAFDTQVRRERVGPDDCTVAAGSDVARCDKTLPAASVTLGSRLHLPLPLPDGAIDDAITLQVDFSSASRFPDVDELYLGGRAPSFPVFGLGDAGLGTERTWQASIGAGLQLPWLALEVGAFASRINDYIAFGPEFGPDGAPVVDVLSTGAYPRFASQAVEAVMSGVDGGAVLLPAEIVSLSVQGAVVRGVDLGHGRELPFMPPPQARAELRFSPPDDAMPWSLEGTRVTTGVVLVARQDRSDFRTDFAPTPPGYALWNASASTEREVFDVVVKVGVEARNILNTRYRDPMTLMRFFADQPGREVWLRVAVAFDDVFGDHDHASHPAVSADEVDAIHD